MTFRTGFGLIAMCVTTACVRPPVTLAPELLRRTVSAPPDEVLASAVRVFSLHGAVVVQGDRSSGIVQAQPLKVESRWEGIAVTQRVDCGRDLAGVDHALSQPIEITLSALAQPGSAGTLLNLRARVTTYDRIARDMGAQGNAVAAGFGGQLECSLQASLVNQLLDEIAE